MNARITLGQLEILVPVSQLREALLQLEPWLEKADPDAGGEPDLFRGAPSTAGRSVKFHLQPQHPIESVLTQWDPTDGARRILNLLLNYQQVGRNPPLEDIMSAVAATHPKGIGSRLGQINEVIRKRGFEPEDAYTSQRTAAGTRTWSAGPRAKEVLKSLEGL